MRPLLSFVLKALLSLLLLFVLFIAFFPAILSTDWGRTQAVDWMNRSISGKMEIRQWDLHWGKGQLLKKILLKDAQGEEILKIDKFSTDAALWQLLIKKANWGSTEVEGLDAIITIDKNGRTNFQKIIESNEAQENESDSSSTIALSNVSLKSQLFVPGHPLSAQIKGLTRQGNLEGSFDALIALHGFWASDWEGLQREAKKYFSIEGSKEAQVQAHIVNFPTDLIDFLASLKNPHLKGELSSLLSDRLNLNVYKEASSDGLSFKLTVATPTMDGQLKGKIQENVLLIEEPALFQLHFLSDGQGSKNLSSDLCQHILFGDDKLTLLHPCNIHIALNQFRFPLDDLPSIRFQLETSLPKIQLPKLTEQGIAQFSELSLKIEGSDLSHFSIRMIGQFSLLRSLSNPTPLFAEPLNVDQTSIWTVDKKGSVEKLVGKLLIHDSASRLEIAAILSNLFNAKGKLQSWNEMSLQATLKGDTLTPLFAQTLLLLTAEQKQKLQALFGESFNIDAESRLHHLNGPIHAHVEGSQGSIELNGRLTEGILTLDKALKCTVEMTPLFSQAFLSKNVPLLNSVEGAENPVALTIEPAGFSCPLFPFTLERVNIEKATLDLGKLRFKNEGELSSILSLIHPLTDDYLTIWFTPLYLKQKEGILSLKRFDMLISHAYTLANWGWVNLMTHEASFDLGLPAQTLNYAFGIKGLDEKYILQIPFVTAKGKVRIDQTKLMTRVSSLLAQSHGGAKGKLLGSFLDAAAAATFKDETPYPPPTTQPFPWAEEFTPQTRPERSKSDSVDDSLSEVLSKTTQDQEIKEKTIKKKKKKKKFLNLDEEHLKDLKEGAAQMLDQWLQDSGEK